MMIQLQHTRQALGHLLMRIALVGLCLFGGNSAAAFGQLNGGPIYVPTLLNGFNSLMSLSRIEVPEAAKVTCSPFGRVGTSEQQLTLSPGGTYLNGVVILTEWDQFRALDLGRMKKAMKGDVLVDLRNIYTPAETKKLGFTYISVGRP